MRGESVQINTKDSNPIFSEGSFSSTPNIFNYISFSIKDLLYWWYIQMPIFYLKKLRRISIVTSDQLSITLLLRNFFVPWKRHKAPVGYFMGIITKVIYLPITISLYILCMLAYMIFFFFWLLIPIVAVLFTLISLFPN